MACRCFWDSDTDSYAQDIFTNVSIFDISLACSSSDIFGSVKMNWKMSLSSEGFFHVYPILQLK